MEVLYKLSGAVFFLGGLLLIFTGLKMVSLSPPVAALCSVAFPIAGLVFSFCFFWGGYRGHIRYWVALLLYFLAGIFVFLSGETRFTNEFASLVFLCMAATLFVAWRLNKERAANVGVKKNFFKIYFNSNR